MHVWFIEWQRMRITSRFSSIRMVIGSAIRPNHFSFGRYSPHKPRPQHFPNGGITGVRSLTRKNIRKYTAACVGVRYRVPVCACVARMWRSPILVERRNDIDCPQIETRKTTNKVFEALWVIYIWHRLANCAGVCYERSPTTRKIRREKYRNSNREYTSFFFNDKQEISFQNIQLIAKRKSHINLF